MQPESANSDAAYVVVARRYRPQAFSDLVGQGQVATALTNAIDQNRIGHAYLFTGARGVGKTSCARIFAKCLNCQTGPTPQPCNECDICQGVATGEDVDVLEIDGASNRGIDEIRQLRANAIVKPSRARFKIYIIDEVHMLTKEAFNALLKTLEEPPEHVKFIFCTTDPEKIPVTVLSRCQRFDFPPIQTESIKDRLKSIVQNENVQADDDALDLLARRAGGSMRDSQSLLEQLLSYATSTITVADVNTLLGTADLRRIGDLVTAIVEQQPGQAMAQIDQAISEGVDAGQLTEQLLGFCRDLMAVKVGCDDSLLIHATPDDIPMLNGITDQLGLEKILAIVQVIDQALTRSRFSNDVRTLLECAVVRACHLDNLDLVPELIGQLKTGVAAKPESSENPSRPQVKKKRQSN